MLFCVSACKRKTVKTKPRCCGMLLRVSAAVFVSAVAVLLLFLAPQWLLVLLIILLAAALFAAVRRLR